MKVLKEMAYSRSDAINKCYDLGKPFIEHFKKIYHGEPFQTAKHHASEMQAWYNEVLELKLRTNKRQFLTEMQIYDWFITRGSDCYTVCNEDEDMAAKYDEFADILLNETDDVLKALIRAKVIDYD